jgi:hypothetical protein
MLDVSAALTNPYTLSTCTVWRRKQIVNNFGEGKQQVEVLQNVQAIIYPASNNKLERRAEAQVNLNSIVLLTRFSLRGESETVDKWQYQPDVIFWKGNPFLVVDVNDYSNFALGFIKVTANSTDIVDLATMNQELRKQSPQVAPA